MEGLFRSKEMDQIEKIAAKAYDLSSDVVYFPVRHHSPACAYHLQRTIEAYMPEVILIEGPSDANEVIPYLADEESKAPLCIYYSYVDRKRRIREEEDTYRCYYPFLDYSPELLAIRQGYARGIPVQFMDLPYPHILIHSAEDRGLRKKVEKQSYHDEYRMLQSRFIEDMCQKEGCRTFHELWEKLFELDGLHVGTETFVKNMLAFCYLTRVDCTDEMLAEDGCTAREQFMAVEIQRARTQYSKVLVVSGGFHTSGLMELEATEKKSTPESMEKDDFGVYAMAYSFEESDQLNGYVSGMPHPAFYQKVWEKLQEGSRTPYEEAVLHFIVRCGSRVRKKEGGLSISDEIEAFHLAKGLKILRDKSECGVFELQDGVRTAFVKGELALSTDFPMKTLSDLFRGSRMGKLCDRAEVPPIVLDFREQIRGFRLKTRTTAAQEAILQIYTSEKHRAMSCFFHQMQFLHCGFCTREKGPDFGQRQHTSLVREVWKYKWSTPVESRLIELSVYGGTVREAAATLLKKKIEEVGQHGEKVSLLLMDAFMMGLSDILADLLPKMNEIIQQDGDFYSMVACISNLHFLYQGRSLLRGGHTEELRMYIQTAYQKAIYLLPALGKIQEEQEEKSINQMKVLYHMAQQQEIAVDIEGYKEALCMVTDQMDCNPAIEGAAVGLLLGLGAVEDHQVLQKAEGYFYGTGEKFLDSARFLKGLFTTGRDLILHQGSLLIGIDHVIRNIDEEVFLTMLPELRLSFSFFAPYEVDQIGKEVAALYGLAQEKILHTAAVEEEVLEIGSRLDAFGVEVLKRWGWMDA